MVVARRESAAVSIALTSLGLAIAAGALTTLSPCVFPILPLVVGGAMQSNRLAPVAMGAGMVLSFAVMGTLLGAFGDALGLDAGAVRVFGALMLIGFGIVMLVPALNARFNLLMSPIAAGANDASARLDTASLLGAFALGGLLGLIWSPCSGPLLASALTLVASEGGAVSGGLILGLFGLGAATPLVCIAYASRAGFSRSRDWVLRRIHTLKQGFAILMIVLGVAILSGLDKRLEAVVTQVLPEAWVEAITRF